MTRETEKRPDREVLTEPQAADYLQVSARTLQAWRVRGGGPRFFRVGRHVRYRLSALHEWMESRTVAHTSESREAGK